MTAPTPAPTRRAIAPDLEPSYTDTFIVGFERELLPSHFIGAQLRRQSDARHSSKTPASRNYPTPTPDAGCSGFIIANLEEARRDYSAWILNFESRAVDRLHVLASYTNSDAKGYTESGWSASRPLNDFDLYPYHFVNRYGYLSYHRKHRVKVNGYVFLPWDFGVAFNGIWGSPFRWTPRQPARLVDPSLWGDIFLEPRGSREGAEWTQLDLQLTKGFTFGRVRLQLIGTVLNLFDSENATAVCDRVRPAAVTSRWAIPPSGKTPAATSWV